MLDLSSLNYTSILPFIAIGFAAQVIDGARDVAFALVTSALPGRPPTLASASVHAA